MGCDLKCRPLKHRRKRQRTAAVQDASRFRGRVEPPPAFGLRQSSAAFIWLRTSVTDTFNRTPHGIILAWRILQVTRAAANWRSPLWSLDIFRLAVRLSG